MPVKEKVKKSKKGAPKPVAHVPATKKEVREKRANVPEARRAMARTKLTELVDSSRQAEEDARAKKQKMFAGVRKAFDAGLSYEEIHTIMGVSVVRVSQILKQERERPNNNHK